MNKSTDEMKDLILNEKTFTIEFHSGIGNSIGGFFYGLYIYSLLELKETHKLIVLSKQSNRGFYSIHNFFDTDNKILLYENTNNENLFEGNQIEIDSKSSLVRGENYYDLKTIIFNINPVPNKYYDDINIMKRIKDMCIHFEIKLKNEIKDKIIEFNNKNFIGKTYGIHWRSTDSKHNHRELNVSKNNIGIYKIIESSDLEIRDNSLPIKGNSKEIIYKNQCYTSKILSVINNDSYVIVFDLNRNNISDSIQIQRKGYILNLEKYDSKYENDQFKIKIFPKIDNLIKKLTSLSSTIKYFTIYKDKIIEKIICPNKNFKQGDVVQISKNNSSYNVEINSVDYKNPEDIRFNMMYHDKDMLNTIEKNPSLKNTIIEDIDININKDNYKNIFVCSDDKNMEKFFIDKYSKRFNCLNYKKEYEVTKVPGLEKYPWYIDNETEKEILNKIKKGKLESTGGPCNNGVLMGIPYNSYQSIEQLKEALIDTIILASCDNKNTSTSDSTFPILGKIIINLGLLG